MLPQSFEGFIMIRRDLPIFWNLTLYWEFSGSFATGLGILWSFATGFLWSFATGLGVVLEFYLGLTDLLGILRWIDTFTWDLTLD